jgi:hypothetical protein
VLADMVRTDRHHHRSIAGDSDLAGAVKVLARAHQSMIWSRRRQANMLRSALREFCPAALAAFDDLTSGDAVEVRRAAPAPVLGAALSRPKIAAALRRGGRQRRIDARAAQIQAALRAPQLAPAPVIAAAMGASVSASVAVIAEMTTQIAALEQQLAADFEQHRRVRRRSRPLRHRQVSQELRRNITDHQSLRHPEDGAGPPRPQPAPRRRDLPLGLRRTLRITWCPCLLRHPPRRW